MSSYSDYEKECKKIEKENNKLLDQFEKWLFDKQLVKKTIRNHISNVDFYINNYLLYEEPIRAADGVYRISMFLGYWFIKKAMWSSVSHIKGNAASLKKFYTFMCERSYIDEEHLMNLKDIIKDEMSEWIEEMERYDSLCDDFYNDPEDW